MEIDPFQKTITSTYISNSDVFLFVNSFLFSPNVIIFFFGKKIIYKKTSEHKDLAYGVKGPRNTGRISDW